MSTSAGDDHETLLVSNLTLTPAGDARLLLGSRLGSTPAALPATFRARNTNSRLGTPDCLFESDLEIVTEIGTSSRAVPPAASAEDIPEAEEVLEDAAAENIRELPENVLIEHRAAFETRVSILIVDGAFLRVSQNAVCFGGLLERLLGPGVVRIFVGMIFDC